MCARPFHCSGPQGSRFSEDFKTPWGSLLQSQCKPVLRDRVLHSVGSVGRALAAVRPRVTTVAFASSGTSASHFGGVHSLGCLSIAALVPFVPSYLVHWLFDHVVGLIGIWSTILVGLWCGACWTLQDLSHFGPFAAIYLIGLDWWSTAFSSWWLAPSSSSSSWLHWAR